MKIDDCFVVAIDGPAGVGKSSTAKAVAERLGFTYVDSGALYRCVGLMALRLGLDLDDDAAVGAMAGRLEVDTADNGRTIILEGQDVTAEIRSSTVSDAASRTSACPSVRSALVELQRRAARPPGAVLEGRDIGTVIFPNADLKVFLSADPGERARRRAVQLGDEAAVERIAKEIEARDRRDMTREIAPLKPAEDALVIDSTHLGFEEVVHCIISAVAAARNSADS